MTRWSVFAFVIATLAPLARVSGEQSPATPSHASANFARVARWHAFIAEAARRFDVPEDWVVAVMMAESGGRTTLNGRPITSPAGAMGLMQLMPRTWGDMRAALQLGADPTDPHDNIMAGTYYLRLMYDRFGYPGLFGAYNAGPARYAAWLEGRGPLPEETRAYLTSVTGDGEESANAAARPADRIFFTLHRSADGRGPPSVGTGLFAVLESMGGEQARRTVQDRSVDETSDIATP